MKASCPPVDDQDGELHDPSSTPGLMVFQAASQSERFFVPIRSPPVVPSASSSSPSSTLLCSVSLKWSPLSQNRNNNNYNNSSNGDGGTACAYQDCDLCAFVLDHDDNAQAVVLPGRPKAVFPAVLAAEGRTKKPLDSTAQASSSSLELFCVSGDQHDGSAGETIQCSLLQQRPSQRLLEKPVRVAIFVRCDDSVADVPMLNLFVHAAPCAHRTTANNNNNNKNSDEGKQDREGLRYRWNPVFADRGDPKHLGLCFLLTFSSSSAAAGSMMMVEITTHQAALRGVSLVDAIEHLQRVLHLREGSTIRCSVPLLLQKNEVWEMPQQFYTASSLTRREGEGRDEDAAARRAPCRLTEYVLRVHWELTVDRDNRGRRLDAATAMDIDLSAVAFGPPVAASKQQQQRLPSDLEMVDFVNWSKLRGLRDALVHGGDNDSGDTSRASEDRDCDDPHRERKPLMESTEHIHIHLDRLADNVECVVFALSMYNRVEGLPPGTIATVTGSLVRCHHEVEVVRFHSTFSAADPMDSVLLCALMRQRRSLRREEEEEERASAAARWELGVLTERCSGNSVLQPELRHAMLQAVLSLRDPTTGGGSSSGTRPGEQQQQRQRTTVRGMQGRSSLTTDPHNTQPRWYDKDLAAKRNNNNDNNNFGDEAGNKRTTTSHDEGGWKLRWLVFFFVLAWFLQHLLP